jgi:hypothetical protein
MVALFSQAQAPQSMPDSIALPQPRTVHPIDAQADSLVQSFTQTIDSAQLEVPVDSSLVATEAPAVPVTPEPAAQEVSTPENSQEPDVTPEAPAETTTETETEAKS